MNSTRCNTDRYAQDARRQTEVCQHAQSATQYGVQCEGRLMISEPDVTFTDYGLAAEWALFTHLLLSVGIVHIPTTIAEIVRCR